MMTYYAAKKLMMEADYYNASIKIGNVVWDKIDNAMYSKMDEIYHDFTCDIVREANKGNDISIVNEDFKPVLDFEDLHLFPIVFEDEIAIILQTFASPGAKVLIYSPYLDGREEKTIKITSRINYFSGDKYSKDVVHAIYDALENDYLISINETDITELNERIEY